MSLRSHLSSLRWFVMLALSTILLLPTGGLAQNATPAATPESVPEVTVPTGITVDLAAMNLLPQEMDPAFVGIGDILVDVNGAVILSRDTESEFLRQQLTEAGLVGEHLVYGAEMVDDWTYNRAGLSTVGEFANADGASLGLATLTAPELSSDISVIEGVPVIGDEAILFTRSVMDPNIPEPYEILTYAFRTDNLVAGISLYSMDGSPLDQDAVQELARLLVDRIDDVRANGSPGLIVPALRVTSGSGFINGDAYEGYLLIDGRLPQPWNEPPDMFEQRQAHWAEANMVAAYGTEAFLFPAGETDYNQSLTVGVQVYEFATAEDAAAFAEHSAGIMVAEDTTFTSLDELATVPGISGVASGLTFTYDLGDGIVTSGQIYWVQSETHVVRIYADIIEGVSDEAMLSLANAQIDCLAAPDAPCAPLPLPAEFAQ